MENFRQIMDIVGTSVDGVGVLIVVGGALFATVPLAVRRVQRDGSYYSHYRQGVGRAILLGLEFLIAGDLSPTVVVALTLPDVLAVGLIVVISMFLSFCLHVVVA